MKRNVLLIIMLLVVGEMIFVLTSCSDNTNINQTSSKQILSETTIIWESNKTIKVNLGAKTSEPIKFTKKVDLAKTTLIVNTFPDFDAKAKRAYELIKSDKEIITTGMILSNINLSMLFDFDVVTINGDNILRIVQVPEAYTSNVPIRVLSYNIRRGLGMDYKTDIKRTVDVIKQLHPDLVSLSEVDSNAFRSGGVKQAKVLGDECGMENRFYKTLDKPTPQGKGKGAYGEGLLSRYHIQKTIYHNLPHKDNEEPRIAIEIEVGIPDIYGHTQTVSFISTHLAHENLAARSNQVIKLLSDLKNVNHPVIISGDLNLLPEQIPLKHFLKAGFKLSDETLTYTFNASKPTKKIDYILTRGNIGVFGPMPRTRVIDEKIASDHLPFLATLAIGPVPANWLEKYDLPVSILEGFIDSDNDTFDNYSEWVAGTDPTNAESFIKKNMETK